MTAELGFSLASGLAALTWLLLILLPRWRPTRLLAGALVPALFAVAYVVLIAPLLALFDGGYGSIDRVQALLTADPRITLAAWLHYLAFDLLIGSSISAEGAARGLPRLIVVPALVLCFLFGPAGWLLFRATVLARRAFEGRPRSQ